mmetsp:Transcript_5176/g.6347  ORF Transcript_5176/g.6347 Transcript_5176/m.6347 type:complete len:80 (-) Transcript_5176:115-354(-)
MIERAAFAFYLIQAILFTFFVSCATYWLASLFTYDYKEMKGWQSEMFLWSGIYLVVTSSVNALHSYSFSILIFKYRRHL